MARPALAVVRATRRRWLESEMPAAVILEWLDATMEVKQLRRGGVALEKFTAIIARHTGVAAHDMLRELKHAPYRV